MRRRKLSDVLANNEARLRETVELLVFATPATIVRGMLTALFWLAPPPHAHEVKGSIEGAFEAFSRRTSDASPGTGASTTGCCLLVWPSVFS